MHSCLRVTSHVDNRSKLRTAAPHLFHSFGAISQHFENIIAPIWFFCVGTLTEKRTTQTENSKCSFCFSCDEVNVFYFCQFVRWVTISKKHFSCLDWATSHPHAIWFPKRRVESSEFTWSQNFSHNLSDIQRGHSFVVYGLCSVCFSGSVLKENFWRGPFSPPAERNLADNNSRSFKQSFPYLAAHLSRHEMLLDKRILPYVIAVTVSPKYITKLSYSWYAHTYAAGCTLPLKVRCRLRVFAALVTGEIIMRDGLSWLLTDTRVQRPWIMYKTNLPAWVRLVQKRTA